VYFLGEKGISEDPKANSQSTFQIMEGISFFSIFTSVNSFFSIFASVNSFLSIFTSVNSFFFIFTSVNLVHNAQVCYFNNVWLMFLVF